jgi:hypothetical protein
LQEFYFRIWDTVLSISAYSFFGKKSFSRKSKLGKKQSWKYWRTKIKAGIIIPVGIR